MLYGKTPAYSDMRSFGSLCYASTLQNHRKKFHSRARKCIFIGYPPNIKGYRLYDLETEEVFQSRDVIFYESEYPFQNSTVKHSESAAEFDPVNFENESPATVPLVSSPVDHQQSDLSDSEHTDDLSSSDEMGGTALDFERSATSIDPP
ncbi:hypothetical protein M569_16029, partial [Genlisea aurea]